MIHNLMAQQVEKEELEHLMKIIMTFERIIRDRHRLYVLYTTLYRNNTLTYLNPIFIKRS